MPDQVIQCPNCGTIIPLSEALTAQIEQSIRVKYQAEAAVKEKELEAKVEAIRRQEKEVVVQRQAMDEQIAQKVAERIKAEQKRIAEQERAKIVAEMNEETKALQGELALKNQKVSELQRQEIELRKKQRDMEQRQQEMELENQRRLDTERKQIEEKARKQAMDEQALRVREKDDKIDSLTKQINELQRKAEQGSQEAQGEALEGALLDNLRQVSGVNYYFPLMTVISTLW